MSRKTKRLECLVEQLEERITELEESERKILREQAVNTKKANYAVTVLFELMRYLGLDRVTYAEKTVIETTKSIQRKVKNNVKK